jgi:hypothetical protein
MGYHRSYGTVRRFTSSLRPVKDTVTGIQKRRFFETKFFGNDTWRSHDDDEKEYAAQERRIRT